MIEKKRHGWAARFVFLLFKTKWGFGDFTAFISADFIVWVDWLFIQKKSHLLKVQNRVNIFHMNVRWDLD